VVLAGGRSRRMGACKALEPFWGRPLVLWAVEALSGICDEVVVPVRRGWARRIGAALPRGARVVEDTHPGLGPVGGLEAGFRAASRDWVAVAPCDSPLVEPRLYKMLFAEARSSDGAVPFVGGFPEPLHGVYRRGPMLRALETVISEGGGSVRDAVRLVDFKRVGPRLLFRADPMKRTFWNLGTKGALRKAEAAAEDLR
jgi:molybdopterin-guanine dinucleotide biosynthesis protein A